MTNGGTDNTGNDATDILIVDDNEINLAVFKRILAADGVNPVVADNGADAVRLAGEHEFALAVLDVHLPGMDGFEVARRMVEHSSGRNMPIIFVTAFKQDEEHVRTGYQLGAVDYLFKPVEPLVLKSKVEVFLQLHRQKRQLEREIAQRECTESALRLAEEKYRTIFENAVEGIFQITVSGRILEANPAMADILGYGSPASLMDGVDNFFAGLCLVESGRTERLAKLETDGKLSDHEYQVRHKDGRIIWLSESSRLVSPPGGGEKYIEGIVQDVTERKRSEMDLKSRATTDPLTGVPNRYLFFDRLKQALARAERYEEMLAVLFVDLDYFKNINDMYGHNTGDVVLRAVARRLGERVRLSDTMARIGGDEFGVLMPQIRESENAASLASDIVAALSREFIVNDQCCNISASVGISIFPRDGSTPEELVDKADAAMYAGKKSGGKTFTFFSE